MDKYLLIRMVTVEDVVAVISADGGAVSPFTVLSVVSKVVGG